MSDKALQVTETKTVTTITPDRIEVLCRALVMGNTHTNACKLAAINYDLFRRWMALGGYPLGGGKNSVQIDPAEADEPYASFALAVIQAKAVAEERAINQVIAAGDRDWKAAAWYLEKTNPDEWAPEKKAASIQIGTTSGVQIFLPDNGRGDVKEIIEGEMRELDD